MARLYTEHFGHDDIKPDFGLLVRGDYMKPVLQSGDLCFVVEDIPDIKRHKNGIGVFKIKATDDYPILGYINDIKDGMIYTSTWQSKREYPVDSFVGVVVGFQRMFRCRRVE